MLVWDLIRTCLKRWYVIVLGVALVAAGTFWIYQKTPLSYEATGSVVLIPPRDSVLVGDNPYLYLGGLEQALGVLSVRMMSSEVMDPLLDKFPDIQYTVGKDITTSGPIMAITIVGNEDAATMAALSRVIELVPEHMNKLQESLDVPEGSRIGTQTLAADEKPVALTRDRTRMVAMAAAGGLTAVLLFTALFDRVLLLWHGRRNSKKLASTAENAQLPGAEEPQVRPTALESMSASGIGRPGGEEADPELEIGQRKSGSKNKLQTIDRR